MAFAATAAREICQALIGLEVVGPAVGIAGVVDRVDPQHQALGPFGFRQA